MARADEPNGAESGRSQTFSGRLAPRIREGGSFVILSGVPAVKITVGTMAVATTSGAADIRARSLALELTPIRVNAISPGVIDAAA
jgi:NAD(P)-dependent dehydrogenase (short-subunit alcohol dehydrogenase family)